MRALGLFETPSLTVVEGDELFLLVQERRGSTLLGNMIRTTRWTTGELTQLRKSDPDTVALLPIPDQLDGGIRWIH